MRRLLCVCLVLALTVALIPSAYAAANEHTISTQEYTLENGFTVTEVITETSMQRASVKQGTKNYTVKDGTTVVAEISFFATFRYDGTTSEVLTKMMLKSNTYDGWTYNQQSFTSSGATVTLKFTISKLFITSDVFTVKLSCDKDGNLY